ncbi:MAG: hypothetical protein ACRYFY_05145 [Janthinobacterium lividum]
MKTTTMRPGRFVTRLLVLAAAGLSLSACVVAPARPYYADPVYHHYYWYHPHYYY